MYWARTWLNISLSLYYYSKCSILFYYLKSWTRTFQICPFTHRLMLRFLVCSQVSLQMQTNKKATYMNLILSILVTILTYFHPNRKTYHLLYLTRKQHNEHYSVYTLSHLRTADKGFSPSSTFICWPFSPRL